MLINVTHPVVQLHMVIPEVPVILKGWRMQFQMEMTRNKVIIMTLV